MTWMHLNAVYVPYACMYQMTNGKLEVRIFLIYDNNMPDAHFPQLQFETPQASVIY